MVSFGNMEPLKRRRSIRIQDFDYSQCGGYFVTICTHNRICLFGDIVDGKMSLNDMGKIVSETWEWLEGRYDYVELAEYMIMPNHLHGILIIDRGRSRTTPTRKFKPLGRLIGAFKTVTNKRINSSNETTGKTVFQRYFYEHVIRNESDLNRIREYIANNPLQWHLDEENPMVNLQNQNPYLGVANKPKE